MHCINFYEIYVVSLITLVSCMSIDQEDEVIYDAEPISCKFPKGFTAEWMNNWEIKETPRSNGSRIDRVCYQF